MHSVYVLQNDNSYEKYIGCTNDLKRRLQEHNAGGQKSTKRKDGVWKIIYTEIFRAKKDAIMREMKLKQNSRGRQELYKRIANSELRK